MRDGPVETSVRAGSDMGAVDIRTRRRVRHPTVTARHDLFQRPLVNIETVGEEPAQVISHRQSTQQYGMVGEHFRINRQQVIGARERKGDAPRTIDRRIVNRNAFDAVAEMCKQSGKPFDGLESQPVAIPINIGPCVSVSIFTAWSGMRNQQTRSWPVHNPLQRLCCVFLRRREPFETGQDRWRCLGRKSR